MLAVAVQGDFGGAGGAGCCATAALDIATVAVSAEASTSFFIGGLLGR